MGYINLDIKNANKYKYEGFHSLNPGEVIYIKVGNRPTGLQIQANGEEYKIVDTVMTDDRIKLQEDTSTLDGWNTVDGDTWKTSDDNIQWDGVVNAIRISANGSNASSVEVSWGIR